MHFNPYKEQLTHPFWFDKMEAIMDRDDHQCVICGFPKKDKRKYRYWDKEQRRLVVHFRKYLFDMKKNQYVEPWKYEDKFLLTVCNWCRDKGIDIFSIPIKKI